MTELEQRCHAEDVFSGTSIVVFVLIWKGPTALVAGAQDCRFAYSTRTFDQAQQA